MKCHGCGADMVAGSRNCPSCGKSTATKGHGILFWIIVGFATLVVVGAIAGMLAQGPSPAPLTPAEMNKRDLRALLARDLQARFLGEGLDVACAIDGPKGERLLITGPSVTRPFAYLLVGETKLTAALERARFTEIDFGGPNYSAGVEAFSLHPPGIPARQMAFDAVAAAQTKADVMLLRGIIEQARPSLEPGDFEFLSAYTSLLEKGYFGAVGACRWEGLVRFHGNDKGLLNSLKKSGSVAEPGTCIRDAGRR